MRDRSKRLHCAVLILDGFQLTSLATLVDTLDSASRAFGRDVCTTRLTTPTGQPARSDCDIEIPVMDSLVWPADLDYVIVLGRLTGRLWRWSSTVSRYLRTADRLKVTIVGVETGVETLARIGLLDGHIACVAVDAQNALQERFPAVEFSCASLMLHDRRRITSLGGVVASDLAAELIATHLSPADAHRAVVALNREGVRPPGTPPPLAAPAGRYADDRVRRAVIAMEQSLDRPRSIDAIATGVGVSRRQLERLFHAEAGESAKGIYLSLRLQEARRRLEQSNISVAAIALMTGFADGAHLARTMRRQHGQTPMEVRKRG